MARANPVRVHTANKITLVLNDKEVGLIDTVRFTDDYAPEPASGIGQIRIQEWVPTQARYQVNVSTLVLRKESLISLGISVEDADGVLTGQVFDIVIQDQGPPVTVLRTFLSCSYVSGDIEVRRHQIVVLNAVFNCLDVSGKLNTTP